MLYLNCNFFSVDVQALNLDVEPESSDFRITVRLGECKGCVCLHLFNVDDKLSFLLKRGADLEFNMTIQSQINVFRVEHECPLVYDVDYVRIPVDAYFLLYVGQVELNAHSIHLVIETLVRELSLV